MHITYYGHSCFLVDISGHKLLFDPFISANPNAEHIDIAEINPDFVLISHGHEDHLADAETILKQSGAKLISNFEIVSWYQHKGIDNSHAMNHGGCFDFPFGNLRYVNAVHSSTLPDGNSGGNPGGFVIESERGTFYYSGDTALHYDMKLLLEQYERIDWAALCIGDNLTMGAKDASRCARWLNVKNVLGLHYDTFPPIAIDREQTTRIFNSADIKLHLPEIGETIGLHAQYH